MKTYLLVEPEFINSSWCKSILDGLYSAFKNRKIKLINISNPEELKKTDEHTFLIVVGSNPNWLKQNLLNPCTNGIHPILLSSQSQRSLPCTYSYVSSDTTVSMKYLLKYFKTLGKTSPALYGVNPNSLSNIARKDKFLLSGIYKVTEDDIYYNNGSLTKCFETFKPNISKYDSVICVNDYAAINLSNLLENEKSHSQNITIATYGETNLLNMFFPDLITVSTCYNEFGKAAVSICDVLSKNPALQCISVSVKPKLNIKTDFKDFENINYENSLNSTNIDWNFYKDEVVNNLMLLENMLNVCDEIDKTILKLLLKNCSYQEMSNSCFISIGTVKYRMKRMCELCKCASKKELLQLLKNIHS